MKDAVYDDGHGPASYALTLHFISQTGMTAAELAKKYQDNVLQQLLEKKVENLRNEREKAEEKRIRNKPKVRRL